MREKALVLGEDFGTLTAAPGVRHELKEDVDVTVVSDVGRFLFDVAYQLRKTWLSGRVPWSIAIPVGVPKTASAAEGQARGSPLSTSPRASAGSARSRTRSSARSRPFVSWMLATTA